MLKITGLWENKDKNGNTYYSGYLGSSKLLIYKNTYKEQGSNQPDYNMYVAEGKKDYVKDSSNTQTNAQTNVYTAPQTNKQEFKNDDIPF